ncbi:ribosomal protein S18-alanine N-acetyltransferase [Ructibacterium gallinarum]|uniref:ribosomal protein S18-alanine N-acetyltransferase n=1 Tax=Ructibacterium gallinarum TaxID=2779355 RepID=UPI001CF8039F|nr:ribosomal protein S18-alanine N-acetyltransferase [Ructibacterium gallinarum]
MIQIEPFSEAALPAVYELEHVCFPKDPWSMTAFRQELTNPLSVFLVATDTDTGRIAGYGGVWLMYDAGNITNIAVHPDFRRKKVGTALLRRLIHICQERGMNSVTLEVRAGNRGAIALYETAGFQICGLRKRYYQDREDALIMTLERNREETTNEDSGH